MIAGLIFKNIGDCIIHQFQPSMMSTKPEIKSEWKFTDIFNAKIFLSWDLNCKPQDPQYSALTNYATLPPYLKTNLQICPKALML
jgi:hypothetical protein